MDRIIDIPLGASHVEGRLVGRVEGERLCESFHEVGIGEEVNTESHEIREPRGNDPIPAFPVEAGVCHEDSLEPGTKEFGHIDHHVRDAGNIDGLFPKMQIGQSEA